MRGDGGWTAYNAPWVVLAAAGGGRRAGGARRGRGRGSRRGAVGTAAVLSWRSPGPTRWLSATIAGRRRDAARRAAGARRVAGEQADHEQDHEQRADRDADPAEHDPGGGVAAAGDPPARGVDLVAALVAEHEREHGADQRAEDEPEDPEHQRRGRLAARARAGLHPAPVGRLVPAGPGPGCCGCGRLRRHRLAAGLLPLALPAAGLPLGLPAALALLPSPRSPGVPMSAEPTDDLVQRASVIRRAVGKGEVVTAMSPYPPPRDFYDEAVDPDGALREAGGAGLALLGPDLAALAAGVREALEDRGVNFRSAGGDAEFHLDPVPRVIGAEEWAALEAGLAQRVRALNAFVADVYGPRRVAEGVVPGG